jgi:DNA polymerase-3 subunit gamma/tau
VALALYRKYRPRTFAEVIGQEHVTEPLMQALRSGRLHHAYLFSGPRGCGKTSSARILARSLNCEHGPTPEPCGVCDSCVALSPDGPGSIDVIEIDAASHGGVDDARDLRERAFFAPVASRFKVYVIDEAHMVSSQGFNALLKLVEEPPDFVKFVFATTEPEKVLGTIKSRTHHYPFRLMPPGVLRPYLELLCREEGVTVEPAVFPLVVRAGGGSCRDTLSVLDQLISGAGEAGVTYARAVALLGVTDVALIDEVCDALAAGDGAAAYATIDRVAEAGHDPRRFASDLLERLRDLIVLQQVPEAATKGIIDAPDDQLERMSAQATRMGPATLSRMADIVHNGLTEMRGTTAPRLLLELIVARMLLPGADESTGALLQRMERMERRLHAASPEAAGPSVASTPSPVRPELAAPPSAVSSAASGGHAASPAVTRAESPTPAPVSAPPMPAPHAVAAGVTTESTVDSADAAPVSRGSSGVGEIDAAAVRRVWDEILATIRRHSPRAWAIAREATVRDVDGDTLVLLFQHAVHADMFTAQPDLLVEAVGEVIGGSWRVRCELSSGELPGVRGESRTPARPAAAPARAVPASDAAGGTASGPVATATGGVRSSPAKPTKAAPAKSTKAAPAARSGRAPSTPRSGEASGGRSSGPSDVDSDDSEWPQTALPGGQPPTPRAPVAQSAAGTRTPAASGRSTAGEAAADLADLEPPFDPDYDFDPGEDSYDIGPATAGEHPAIALLTERFGAERLGG